MIFFFFLFLFLFLFLFFPPTHSHDSPFAYSVLLGALAKKHQESEVPKARLSFIDSTFKKVEIDGVIVHVSDLTTTYENLMENMKAILKDLTFGVALPKDTVEWAKLEKPNDATEGFSPIPDNSPKVSDALCSSQAFRMSLHQFCIVMIHSISQTLLPISRPLLQ